MNRETKRLLQRQGQLAPDGSYAPKAPTPPRITKPEVAPRQGGIFARIVTFFSEVKSEFKKVVWPTKTEVVNYSILVIISLIIVGLLVFGLDYGCTKFVLFLFKK
jgi:preprotein translocase subunit SecE